MKVDYQGNTYNVNDEAMDDIDIFEDIIDLQNGNITPMKRVIEAILGVDGYKTLKDSFRDEKGHARTSEVMQGFNDIMTAAGEDKKK